MLTWRQGSAELSKLQLIAGVGDGRGWQWTGRWKPDQVGIVRDLGFTLSMMGVESP